MSTGVEVRPEIGHRVLALTSAYRLLDLRRAEEPAGAGFPIRAS